MRSLKKRKKRTRSFGTDWNLRDFYRRFNKKYFSNSLPKDMPVSFRNIPTLGNTVIHKQTFRPLYIQITNRIRFSSRLCMGTVLHEMIHVAHPEKRGHRGWFDKEMLRMVKRGAMNGLW
jgi:hypothetical protein